MCLATCSELNHHIWKPRMIWILLLMHTYMNVQIRSINSDLSIKIHRQDTQIHYICDSCKCQRVCMTYFHSFLPAPCDATQSITEQQKES